MLDTLTNFWYLDADSYRGSLQAELVLWTRIWIKLRNVTPKYFIKCLKEFDKNISPTLHGLLKINAMISVTTGTCKHFMSTLRRVKSYPRNASGQEWLHGLDLLSIHRDVLVNVKDILNELAHNKKVA